MLRGNLHIQFHNLKLISYSLLIHVSTFNLKCGLQIAFYVGKTYFLSYMSMIKSYISLKSPNYSFIFHYSPCQTSVQTFIEFYIQTFTVNVSSYFRYLYIYYLPSGLFVAVSWVSFVIPPEVVPGRMALLVTLFLVLTNIFNTITNVSPNVEGMTAISSWMIACMFFVFLALLEYAAILYFLLVSMKY